MLKSSERAASLDLLIECLTNSLPFCWTLLDINSKTKTKHKNGGLWMGTDDFLILFELDHGLHISYLPKDNFTDESLLKNKTKYIIRKTADPNVKCRR